MRRRHEEDVQKWNKFWGVNDGGLSLGPKAGDEEAWTIECNEYKGPGREELADRMAAALQRLDGLRPDAVRVQHDESSSHVFYGSYSLKYAAAKIDSESQLQGDVVIELNDAIKKDLSFIRALAMGEQYPFFSARAIPQPIEDAGPREWDLRNAKGVYTLNVGVTYNTPTLHNYKQAAVEWVKALREDGHEAYYYHSPEEAKSSICVGTFGEDALAADKDSRKQYSEAVHALRNQGDFKYNLENGCRTYRKAMNADTGRTERIPNFSFLVKIPADEGKDE